MITPKKQLFIEAYLTNPNATRAAIAAGYSEKTARSQGQRLLTDVDIQRAVGKRLEQAVMSANEVLTELTAIATADWQDFVEIKHDKEGRVIDAVLILKDKLKALELVGKYHKLFTDRQEINNTATTTKALEAFHIWIEKNPGATLDQKIDAIRIFAAGGKIDEKELAQRAGVEMVSHANN